MLGTTNARLNVEGDQTTKCFGAVVRLDLSNDENKHVGDGTADTEGDSQRIGANLIMWKSLGSSVQAQGLFLNPRMKVFSGKGAQNAQLQGATSTEDRRPPFFSENVTVFIAVSGTELPPRQSVLRQVRYTCPL